MVWPLALKKPSRTDQGVAIGVTKFRMASGGLKVNTYRRAGEDSFEIAILLSSRVCKERKKVLECAKYNFAHRVAENLFF